MRDQSTGINENAESLFGELALDGHGLAQARHPSSIEPNAVVAMPRQRRTSEIKDEPMVDSIDDRKTVAHHRVCFKCGDIEVSGEGTPAFLQDDLFNLLKKFLQTVGDGRLRTPVADTPPKPEDTEQLLGTTASVAAKLGVKTGPDLLLAAAARLTLVQGKDVFTRQELLEEMRTATSYFTRNHSKNLSQSVTNLMRERKLLERSPGTYALEARTKEQLSERMK